MQDHCGLCAPRWGWREVPMGDGGEGWIEYGAGWRWWSAADDAAFTAGAAGEGLSVPRCADALDGGRCELGVGHVGSHWHRGAGGGPVSWPLAAAGEVPSAADCGCAADVPVHRGVDGKIRCARCFTVSQMAGRSLAPELAAEKGEVTPARCRRRWVAGPRCGLPLGHAGQHRGTGAGGALDLFWSDGGAGDGGEVTPGFYCGPDEWRRGRKCCLDCTHGRDRGAACEGCGGTGQQAELLPVQPPAGEVQDGSRLISMGGAGRFSWRLKYEGGTRDFVGLLVNDQAHDIVHTERGRDSEAVMNALLARLDSMLDPRDTRAYEPPTVTRIEGSEVPALLRLNAARMGADRRIGDIVHTMQRLRRSLVDVALAWYERQREEWRVSPALRDMNAADREACRQLHERQICALFEKIAGAL